mgnify:FL=1|tara:strand:+ start:181 stop:513 length:333 start_codon:yes stop_codon:yes gene_type:complete
MPNDCSNLVTITSKYENDLEEMLQEMCKEIPNMNITERGRFGIRMNYVTAWKPDIQMIGKLVDKYPLVWLKNEWISEDGKAGIWVGNRNKKKFMDWDDLSLEDENFHFPR